MKSYILLCFIIPCLFFTGCVTRHPPIHFYSGPVKDKKELAVVTWIDEYSAQVIGINGATIKEKMKTDKKYYNPSYNYIEPGETELLVKVNVVRSGIFRPKSYVPQEPVYAKVYFDAHAGKEYSVAATMEEFERNEEPTGTEKVLEFLNVPMGPKEGKGRISVQVKEHNSLGIGAKDVQYYEPKTDKFKKKTEA